MNKRVRLISLFLCLALIMCVTSLTVSARTLFVSGDWSYEKINNNTELQVAEYNGEGTELTTEQYFMLLPVTTIGSNVFTANTNLESITLTDNVKTVSNNAFTNASNLKTVNFSSSVSRINYSAFAGCSFLSSINLEDTKITTVSYSCFMNCDSLTEVTLPDTVVTIAEQAFAYCDSLSKITIPASVTTIHEKAFYNSPNVVIYCYKDSAAHTYAETNSIEYVLLDPVETYILGDADNDGSVTVLDATYIQLVLAQKTEAIDGLSVRGDTDKDGIVSVMDATLIQQHIADLLDDTSEIGKSFEY